MEETISERDQLLHDVRSIVANALNDYHKQHGERRTATSTIVDPIERKIGILGRVIKDIGFPIVMVGVFVGWFSGWIPSPLTSMAADLKTHVQDVNRTIDALGALTKEIRIQNRRMRYQQCLDLKSDAVREACIKNGGE